VEVVLYLSVAISLISREDCEKADVADQTIGLHAH
jgi:hypothetical protein